MFLGDMLCLTHKISDRLALGTAGGGSQQAVHGAHRPQVTAFIQQDAKRRNITNADKRRIVLAAAACTKPGEIGALMRREGVYSSALATWRRQYAAGELNGADSKRRGPKVAPAREELKQLALMTRERDKLRVQLSNAQLVIEVQKKVAALLEQLEPLSKFASP